MKFNQNIMHPSWEILKCLCQRSASHHTMTDQRKSREQAFGDESDIGAKWTEPHTMKDWRKKQ